jgi:hypothetical protein
MCHWHGGRVNEKKMGLHRLDEDFIAGAISRFTTSLDAPKNRHRQTSYCFNSPCALPIDEKSVPLVSDGGLKKVNHSSSS